MSCYSKEKIERNDYNNICKSHSARSDRAELYRICPSKLSKRELEDLYFSLLESNLDLKRTISVQQDKIKGLSTKMQRMTAAQKNLQNKETKECCIGTKTVVAEQMESISELKRANQRLGEKIRQLNMQLCSAKQFCKRSPAITTRCMRCSTAPPNTASSANTTTTPKKHNCLNKASETVLQLSTSYQNMHRDAVSMKSAQTETCEPQKVNPDLPCDENRCRTVMEELKQKILNLQEELNHVHEEYSTRISRLESEICEVRKENLQVCAERTASQHELSLTNQRTNELMTNCRTTEAKCAELSTQLSIERRKVAEMETRLKAANISDRVNKTIEGHLNNINETQVPTQEINVPTKEINVPTKEINTPTYKSKIPTRKTKVPALNANGSSAENKLQPKSLSPPDTVQDNKAESNDCPKCCCLSNGRYKTPTKDTKDVKCASPPGEHGESIKTRRNFLPSTTSSTDAQNQKCGCPTTQQVEMSSTPIKDAQNQKCGCPTTQQVEMSSTPIKDAQNQKCGCPTAQQVEMSSTPIKRTGSLICDCGKEGPSDGTTPVKDAKNVTCGCTFPTKDSQCVNSCICTGQNKNEFFQSTPTKTSNQAPNDSDMNWSPKTYHEHDNLMKTLDDSGYTDTRSHNTSDEVGLNKMNKELMERILELQSQVDSMKITGATELPGPIQRKFSHTAGTSLYGATPRNTTTESFAETFGDKITNHRQSITQNETPAPEKHEPNKSELEYSSPKRMSVVQGAKTSEIPFEIPRTSVDHGTKKPAMPLGEQKLNIPEDQEYNKSIAHSKQGLEMMPDETTKASDDTFGSMPATKYEIMFGTPNSVNDDSRKPDTVETVPRQLQMSPTEERRPRKSIKPVLETNEYRGPNKTEIVTDIPKVETTEERKQSNTEFSTGTREVSNKSELVSGNPEMHEIESIPSTSKLSNAISNTPSHDYQEPEKTKAMTAKQQLLEDQGMIVPELLLGAREAEIKMNHGTDKSELDSGALSNDIKVMPTMLPITENVAPKMTEIKNTVDEGCQYCPACTYDKECASELTIVNNDNNEPKSNEVGAKIGQVAKNDQHNSLQIPGPIPTGVNGKDWKRNVFKQSSLDKKKPTHNYVDKDKPKQKRESLDKDPQIYTKKPLEQTDSVTTEAINVPDVTLLQTKRKKIAKDEPEEHDVSQNNSFRFSKDSIPMTHQILTDSHTVIQRVGRLTDLSMQNFYVPSDEMIQTAPPVQEQGTQVEQKTDQKPQEQTAQIVPEQDNTVPPPLIHRASKARTRDVSVYRRHSGTLCFRTLPTDDDSWLTCCCEDQVDGKCTKPSHKGTQVQDQVELPVPEQRPTSEQGTYTVDSKQCRSTSPDVNTETEISHMSDLPLEKDLKSPIRNQPLSPGEDKTATTQTDTSTSTVTNSYSLSEGELPPTYMRRISQDNAVENAFSVPVAPEEPVQKMEAALQAITDELERCKTLLSTQRPTEASPHRISSQSQTLLENSGIPLRRGIARQSIGDVYAPKCIFTLHIGTVVLSDEAVLNSRKRNLVLTWKFYDQNIAMSRMRAGRVVHFDFSTEYDVKITDDFLHYLKFEEMPIVISELDKENEPFASCALPLRDALLHTNRRADMSLALVAGPQMISARASNNAAADALDAGDEVGVIDLWCMLRVDTKMLSKINRAIAQAPRPKAKPSHLIRSSSSRVMQQIMDDQSNECLDLDLSLQQTNAAHLPPVTLGDNNGNVYQDEEYKRTSHRWDYSPMLTKNVQEVKEEAPPSKQTTRTQNYLAYDPNSYPAGRERRRSTIESTLAPPPPPLPLPIIFDEDPLRETSAVIINEVTAKIKSPEDMKQALEKNCLQNDLTRLAKVDEDVASQAQSSIGSLKSVFARLQRRGSPRSFHSKTDNPQSSSLLQEMRSGYKTQDPSLKTKDRVDLESMETYKKYENIAKLIGPNRGESSKKSVTIFPNYLQQEEPQKEPQKDIPEEQPPNEDTDGSNQCLHITVLWLALNEECEAMVDPHVQRVYVAYTFLGRHGAELETPFSLPKPKHYVDKCYFNFKKTFDLEDNDLPMLGHMARCRASSKMSEDEKHCIIFSVVSEPPEDPLGIESCEDIGYAYLYLGDLLAYSAGSYSYTEVIPVHAARGGAAVCGVLAVRMEGLDVVRRCQMLSQSERDLNDWSI